jgi:hypothetical protein
LIGSADAAGMTNPMTTTADVIYSSSGSTPARLGIGTANQVLAVNSGATAPEWQTISSGGMTLIITTTLTGHQQQFHQYRKYKDLQIIISNSTQIIRMYPNNVQMAECNSNRMLKFRWHQHCLVMIIKCTFQLIGDFKIVKLQTENSVDPGLKIDYEALTATTWKKLSIFHGPLPSNFKQLALIKLRWFTIKLAAITSLNFFPESGNFTSGTVLFTE